MQEGEASISVRIVESNLETKTSDFEVLRKLLRIEFPA